MNTSAQEAKGLTKARGNWGLYIQVGFIALMWLIKVVQSVFFMDTMLQMAESTQRFFLYALGYGVFTVVSVTLLLHLSGERYADIGFSRQHLLKQLGNGLLFGVLIFCLNAFVLGTIVDALLPQASAQGIDMGRLFENVYNLPLWVLMALFKGGFSEELWRIFILTRFEKCFGKPGLVFALLFGSVMFGFGHLYQGVGGMLQATIRGLLYAAVYLRKRRAWEAVSAHAAFDMINITLGYILYAS